MSCCKPRHLILPLALAAGAVAFVAGCARSGPVGNRRVPEPARSVDLHRYLGRWYEIGRYDQSFEKDCEGVTADYSLRPDGLVRVINTCRAGAPDGPTRAIEGKARIVPGSSGAKLKVSFFGPFFFGNYWVLDHAEDYAWSIVGEPSGRYLWILCREATPAIAVKERIFSRAQELGYDLSLIRPTRQPPGA